MIPFSMSRNWGKTAAELTREEKSAISHRGQALKLLLEAMRNG